jgi:frataxin-like iron-binding protein CyaY
LEAAKLLERLYDKLDEVDSLDDVLYSNGVLTVKCDDQNTYVINKQEPNK